MRVISGSAKGIQLQSVPGKSTRPITDRVKEALFNILGPSIVSEIVLDLFGGTGAVGIEALSRGAEHAVFLETNFKAFRTIQQNLKTTHLEPYATVLKKDAFVFLKEEYSEQFDLVYIAPPQYEGLWLKALQTLDENPDAFAAVFGREFRGSRRVAATSLEIFVPRIEGVSLASAGGFPVREQPGGYSVYTGNLLYGQTRKVFLTFQTKAGPKGDYTVAGIQTAFSRQGRLVRQSLDTSLTVRCDENPEAVLGSIHKQAWEQKVLLEDYNRLREEVALDVKSGDKENAIRKIDAYYRQKKEQNQKIQSHKVEENLEQGVAGLKTMVSDTFEGAPAEVSRKQKANAKTLQYKGYSGRRSKQ